jgi:hypothetical protein
MKSPLGSVFRITILAIVLIAVPGLKHSAHACSERSTEIYYYNRFIACTPEAECGPRVLVGQQIWDCDGSYSSWGHTSSVSETFRSACTICEPE